MYAYQSNGDIAVMFIFVVTECYENEFAKLAKIWSTMLLEFLLGEIVY